MHLVISKQLTEAEVHGLIGSRSFLNNEKEPVIGKTKA